MSALVNTDPAAQAKDQASHTHPLIHAGRWIAADLFSTLLFVGLYAVTHSVYWATGLAIGAGVLQIAYLKLRRQQVDAMQWASLGLVVVFGGASLLTHDPRFVMLKPSLIYVALGVVMMQRGWMVRYIPPVARAWGEDVTTVFGYLWAVMMFATAGLNLALVANGDPKLWAVFIGVFPIASKMVLVAIQYLATRMIIVGRMRGAGTRA